MESTIYTVNGQQFELQHHGVKGMKWGVRKTRKWATAKHQPSSARSSALAGLYAATGNARVGRALDKSNDRDAANWQRAKKEYKEYSDRKAAKKQKRQAIVAENLARERAALKESADVAKFGAKVAVASAVGAAALAGVISVIGRKTPSQATSYANVGRAVINTIAVPTIPIPTIPINRTSW